MSDNVYVASPVAAPRRRLTFTRLEWGRLAGLYGFVAFLHVLGWGLFLHYSAQYPALVGLGFAAYMFGLRHAFDADHIAAIDDTVRYLLQKGKTPLGIGFFFSLGHSTIVFGLAIAIAFAAATVKQALPELRNLGMLIGAGVSGTFLWIIGILNLLVLLDILNVWKQAKTGQHSHAHLEELLTQRGLINRLFGGRLQKVINHSWQMYPLGLLFGLGFDTASEVGLLAMTAGASAGNLPIAAVLSLPILFAAGMSVMDTTDGVLMSKAYNWAFLNPLRKIFYNITTTGLSIAVALIIGSIELLQVFISMLSLHGTFFDFVAGLNFGILGYVIVGLFLFAWGLSVAVWKFGRVEQRYSLAEPMHTHPHQHESGVEHSHSTSIDECASRDWKLPRSTAGFGCGCRDMRSMGTMATKHVASREFRNLGFGILASLAMCAAPARADTVASLLGNFTINQFCGLALTGQVATVHYVVVFGQLPALRELHLADADGDGVTSQAERDAYVQKLAPGFADQLKLAVDGVAVPLHVTHWTSSLPTEQGGFSLRLDVDFSADLPPDAAHASHRLSFENQNYAGKIGWHEIAVTAAPPVQVFDTDAFGSSLTNGLTEALRTLPAAGPLDERVVRLSFIDGPAPGGARLLQPRPNDAVIAVGAYQSGTGQQLSSSISAAAQNSGSAEARWLQQKTRSLIGLISAPNVAPQTALLALLAALVLGALHAFSPGHGKTIVGAYLIGSRGTPRHAAFLGFTVTVTHTLGVFALGFATLFASRYVVPERLLPILSLVSGLLVLGMGLVLLVQRWSGARLALAERAPSLAEVEFHALDAGSQTPAILSTHGHSHGQLHTHDHAHPHDHATQHAHSHDGALMHSHGGSLHSHLPPGAAGEGVTWRSLLALGVSGGLVPCPSAMVLLLAAVALNKTAYGLLLVVAFSVGLAVTLTLVGLLFLYARNRLAASHTGGGPRWLRVLPLVSAAAITLLGLAICYGALVGARSRSGWPGCACYPNL